MKPLIIYHADCTDGFGAAFAAWLKLGDEAEYLSMQYGWVTNANDLPCVKGRDVYILDFSFPRGIMETLMILANRVVWLDHHKTAFEMWCGVQYLAAPEGVHQAIGMTAQHTIILNNFKSGALLAWEYFHPGTEVPMLIQHIDDRDRWQFKLEGSKELHAALASMKPWSFQQWYGTFYGLDQNGDRHIYSLHATGLYEEGAAILRAQNAHVQSMVKQARKCCIVPAVIDSYDSYKKPWVWDDKDQCYSAGLSCNAQLYISELGHELANTSGTFGLVWYLNTDNRVKCSLRSNGNYDVSAIAKAFGGGGHRNAAGFETDINTLLGWLR